MADMESTPNGQIAMDSEISYWNDTAWVTLGDVVTLTPNELSVNQQEVKVYGKRIIKKIGGYIDCGEWAVTILADSEQAADVDALVGIDKDWRVTYPGDIAPDYFPGNISKLGKEMGEGDSTITKKFTITLSDIPVGIDTHGS